MTDNKTTYFHKMMGMPFSPNSIVILGGDPLRSTILVNAYLRYLLEYQVGSEIELWEDRSWMDLRYRKMLKSYIGSDIKHYKPVKIFEQKDRFDTGIRKLYDEFVLRRSNRHSQAKKIIYNEHCLTTASKPSNLMIEEILKDGGRKCNIQFIAQIIKGLGNCGDGLPRQFDIRIAFTPLLKADSKALFDTDKYATTKKENYVLFAYKNKIDKVPVFKYDFAKDSGSGSFLELIKSWSF